MNKDIITGCRVEVFETNNPDEFNKETFVYEGTIVKVVNIGDHNYLCLLILKDNGTFGLPRFLYCRLKSKNAQTEAKILKIKNKFSLMELD